MGSQDDEAGGFTLFVGEGDFSFSANYIVKSSGDKGIFATCLNSGCLNEKQENNIKIIEHSGGKVYTDVDATCLESHHVIGNLKFTKIFFNFPHIPGKMNIRENRKLVQQFFISAKKVLEDQGLIFVTLCRGQGGTEVEKTKRKWCDTWQVVSLAASASLILNRVKSFNAKEFETYECTGFRGLQKPFHTDGALTHIFCHGKAVEVCRNKFNIQNYMSIESYIQACENLHRDIYRGSAPPSLRILHNLNTFTEMTFTSDQVFIYDLLSCRNSNFSSSDSEMLKFSNLDYCEDCLSNLFSNYLSKRSDNCITSMICNICCSKNIKLNKHPFPHLVCYFSDNIELLQKYLLSILEYFNQEYIFYMDCKEVSKQNGNADTSNKLLIGSVIHNFQASANKEIRIKNIMNLYVSFLIENSNGVLCYSVVDFFLSDHLQNEKSDNCMKIGNIIQCCDNLKVYFCILLNLDLLASLKFHVMDYRILLSNDSYYEPVLLCERSQEVYRSPSVYPPTYIHDISFYINGDFCENSFFLVIRNIVGYLIKSVTLIDSFCNVQDFKRSRCYRFMYQSVDRALTKENANIIHTEVMRKNLAKSLNIILR